MTFRRTCVLAIVASGVFGCSAPTTQFAQGDKVAIELEAKKQKELFIQTYFRDQMRVASVAAPLLTANADLCRDKVAGYLGMNWWNVNAVPKDYREAATTAYRLTNVLQVSTIVPGSPAQRAGILPGDHIVKFDGRDAPVGDEAVEKLRERVRDRVTDKNKRLQPTQIVLRRNAHAMQAIVTPMLACDFSVAVQNEDTVNAYADGKSMLITQGMLRFVETDEELAFIVAHELAHNAMGHIDAKKTNAMAAGAGGLVVDILAAAVGINTGGAFMKAAANAGAGAYSVDFEREADYVGLYMMARAGYRTDGAANVWRRMAMRSPGSIAHSQTHPTSPDRFVSLEAANVEVERKRAAGAAMLPEMKK
jgi:Zn-dependent protease with chaperone function